LLFASNIRGWSGGYKNNGKTWHSSYQPHDDGGRNSLRNGEYHFNTVDRTRRLHCIHQLPVRSVTSIAGNYQRVLVLSRNQFCLALIYHKPITVAHELNWDKLNLSLCLINHRAMQTHRGVKASSLWTNITQISHWQYNIRWNWSLRNRKAGFMTSARGPCYYDTVYFWVVCWTLVLFNGPILTASNKRI
jgi:hypothetical protein